MALFDDIAENRSVRVGDLAKAMSMPKPTLYAAVNRGEIRAVRIGRAVSIPAAEARRLLGIDDPRAA